MTEQLQREQETEQMTKEEARQEILMVRQRVAVMGANDFEFSALDNILEQMEKGKIEPSDAVAEARVIEFSKQDYH